MHVFFSLQRQLHYDIAWRVENTKYLPENILNSSLQNVGYI